MTGPAAWRKVLPNGEYSLWSVDFDELKLVQSQSPNVPIGYAFPPNLILPLAKALRTAEAALADIGDAERLPTDDVAWCENRAAEALPDVRAALQMLGVEF